MGRVKDLHCEWLDYLESMGFASEEQWEKAKAVDIVRWLKRVRKLISDDFLDQDDLFRLQGMVANRIKLEESVNHLRELWEGKQEKGDK